MLSTKNLVSSIKEVPSVWVFEHYCKLPEILTGQEIKIRSPLKEKLLKEVDRTPSMIIYKGTNKYRFTDYSTGLYGDHIDYIQYMHSCNYGAAAERIVNDYNAWKLQGGQDSIREFREHTKYQVTGHITRLWTLQDQQYWTQFNIGSRLLEEYCVKPLQAYTMTKLDDELTITGDYLYGYCKQDGTLYKIYQPMVPEYKFIKVCDYVQGSEQCRGNPFLLYGAGLKDIMAVASYSLRLDLKSPDSENSLFTPIQVRDDKIKYQWIGCLFDNDPAGIKAARKYQEKYGIQPVWFPYEKDISDSIKKMGAKRVKQLLVPAIDRQLNN